MPTSPFQWWSLSALPSTFGVKATISDRPHNRPKEGNTERFKEGICQTKFEAREMESESISKHHNHEVGENRCSSTLTMHVKAPVDIVWSLVRRFDQPQTYKPFVSRCMMKGELKIGSLREVNVKSGLPATTSTERLELLDDDEHIFGITIVDGDHRLRNYSSVVTLHPEIIEGRPGTLVVESFVVDVPNGNTKEETVCFVKALINCNLKSLADVSERMAEHTQTKSTQQMNLVCCSKKTLIS